MPQRDPNSPTAVRRELARLASSKRTRRVEFSVEAPTDWRPHTVIDPRSGAYFTDHGAWEFIVELIEAEQPIRIVELTHPPGKKGYVMLAMGCRTLPDIYIKLQLKSGVVYGRSFHLSNKP